MNGSFRGVPFRLQRTELEVGRRGPANELPFDERGSVRTDVGRRARRHTVRAILIGSNRESDKDRLIKALEARGPGLLVHPDIYPGSLMVTIPEPARLVESTEMGGVTEVEFTAVESRDKAPAPGISADKRATVATKARALRTVSKEHLVDTLDLSGVQDFVRSANVQTLDTVIGDLRELNGTISAALSVPGRFASQIDSVARNVEDLINTPDRLFDSLDGAYEKIIGSCARVAGALGFDVDPSDENALRVEASTAALANLRTAIREAVAFGSDDPVPTDPTTLANRAAILNSQRADALSYTADAAAGFSFESAQDARGVRDLLGAAIVVLASQVEDAPLFDALWDLRASIAQYLSGAGLPSSTTHTPAETTTVFEVSYDLYGDSTRSGEIATRNNVKHPLFVPGLQPLEVLSE